MRFEWVLVTVAGCGRIGFDEAGDQPPAQPPALGILDDTFGDGGVTRTELPGLDLQPYAVLERPGGYLVAGVQSMGLGENRMSLIGLTGDGELDITFAGDGITDVGATSNDFGYSAMRIGPDRILLGGDGKLGSMDDDMTIGIVDDAGLPVSSFGAGGFVRLDVEGASRQDTARRAVFIGGSVIACGNTGYDLPDGELVLARLNLAGAPVAGWGTGGQKVDSFVQGELAACKDVVQLDNRLIAVGQGTNDSLVVAAYLPDGTRDMTFAGGAYLYSGGNGTNAQGVAIVEGDIVAVGENRDGAVAIRLAADGTPVSTFGDNGVFATPTIDRFDAVAVQSDGKIVATGSASGVAVVVRFAADGTFDPTFGTGGIVEVRTAGDLDSQDLHIDAEGRIVIVAIEDGSVAITARVR